MSVGPLGRLEPFNDDDGLVELVGTPSIADGNASVAVRVSVEGAIEIGQVRGEKLQVPMRCIEHQ